MSKTKQTKNKVLKRAKRAESKVKLISYTVKATIPTGQYANIQPEVTVQAETLEQAERLVMPYIETLFAKYRDGGVRNIEPVRPVVAQKPSVAPQATAASVPVAPAPQAPQKPVQAAPAPISKPAPVPTPVAPAAIVMTVPFTRAKATLESCTSLTAVNLVAAQVEKSTKLVDAEKAELRKLVSAKMQQINGNPA